MSKPLFTDATPAERLIWVLSFLLPVVFTGLYLSHTIVFDAANPHSLAHFVGHKPFQLRVLAPSILALLEICGIKILYGIGIIVLSSSIALGIVFRWYLNEFLPPKVANWASLLVWLPMQLFYSHYWFHSYDVPSVLFLTLGLLFLQRQEWTRFGVLLFVASLNRESSLLMVLCYGATYASLGDKPFWRRLAAYIGIWAAVKFALAILFLHSPGKNMEWQLAENIEFLTHPTDWKVGFMASLLVLIELFGVALWKWKLLPRLMQVCVVVGSLHLFLLGFVGVLFETRLFAELIPLLLPAVLVGLIRSKQTMPSEDQALIAA